MPPVGPIKRKDLIYYLRRSGFEGPYAGRRHQFMIQMNGIVYVDTGNSAHGAFIYAFRARSGVLLWQHAQGPDGLGTVSVIKRHLVPQRLGEP